MSSNVKSKGEPLMGRLNRDLNILGCVLGILLGAIAGVSTALLLGGPLMSGAMDPIFFLFLVFFVVLLVGSFVAGLGVEGYRESLLNSGFIILIYLTIGSLAFLGTTAGGMVAMSAISGVLPEAGGDYSYDTMDTTAENYTYDTMEAPAVEDYISVISWLLMLVSLILASFMGGLLAVYIRMNLIH